MKFYAKECQDVFVACVLDQKINGTYLEIGGCYPIKVNNTYALESQYGWSGVSYELDKKFKHQWANLRKNPCLFEDALVANYEDLFHSNYVDYLSIDIEPADNTFFVLKRIFECGLKFGVVTFEHARSQFGDEVANEQREYMKSEGYTLVIEDVMWGKDFLLEDWWIYEPAINNDNWKYLENSFVSMDKACITKETKDDFLKIIPNIEFHQ